MFRRSNSLLAALTALAVQFSDRIAAIPPRRFTPPTTGMKRAARLFGPGCSFAPKPRSRYAEQKQGASRKKCRGGKKARAQRRRSRMRA